MDTNADETTPSRGFYASARGAGAGAGGKLKRPPSRKPRTTPYSRPPTNQAEKRRFPSSVVDPAYRLISGGATRLFPSFFSPASSSNALPAPDVQHHDDEQDAEIEQNADAEERNGDLNILTGNQDNAEFALAMCPTEPYVLSGGKDKTVALWSIQDNIAASTTDPAKSPGSGGSIIKPGDGNEKAADGPSVAQRGVYQGHEDTVGDVAFCPTSSQEFFSVGDDSCLIPWDARVGSSPAVKNLVTRTETAGPSRVGNSSNDCSGFQGHIVDDDSSSSHESWLSEIEQLLKGKKFSRDEVNRLLEIILSKAVEHPSMVHRTEKLSSTSGGEAKGPVITHAVPKAVSGELSEDTSKAIWGTSTPLPHSARREEIGASPSHIQKRDEIGASPIEVAKAYMGSRTSDIEDWAIMHSNDVASTPFIPAPSPKPSTCWPRSMHDYSTPQSERGRFGLHNFPRTAYPRTIISKSKSKFSPLHRRRPHRNIFIGDDLLLLCRQTVLDSDPKPAATAGDEFPLASSESSHGDSGWDYSLQDLFSESAPPPAGGDEFPLASAASSYIPQPPHVAINIEEEPPQDDAPPPPQDDAPPPPQDDALPPPLREAFSLRGLWEEVKDMDNIVLIVPEASLMAIQWFLTDDFGKFTDHESGALQVMKFVMDRAVWTLVLSTIVAGSMIPFDARFINRGWDNAVRTHVRHSVFSPKASVELMGVMVNGVFACFMNAFEVEKFKSFASRAMVAYLVRVGKRLATRYCI